jgi:hypothetical protein
VKRTPRLTPITNCAAFANAAGIADSVMPAMVKPIATTSDPMNQGLARPRRCINRAPATVHTPSASSPDGCTIRGPGDVTSTPVRPLACRPKGITSTTTIRRRLCAAATRSVRAPTRSASKVISEAPPTAPAKKAVARMASGATPARRGA